MLHMFLHKLKYYFHTVQQGLSDLFSAHIRDWKKRFNGSTNNMKTRWYFFYFWMNHWLWQAHFTQVNIPSDIRREHKVMTSKWVVEPFCTKQPLAKQQSASKSIPVCAALKCVCALLCVSLPVALARLLPPLWLCCAQTDSSPTAAPAHCLNMFWQRKHYHSSRRPSAARSMKLRRTQWLWSFRGRPGFSPRL